MLMREWFSFELEKTCRRELHHAVTDWKAKHRGFPRPCLPLPLANRWPAAKTTGLLHMGPGFECVVAEDPAGGLLVWVPRRDSNKDSQLLCLAVEPAFTAGLFHRFANPFMQ